MEKGEQIKYVVCPGLVVSKTNGQLHYIEATALMRLYGVDPQECYIYEAQRWRSSVSQERVNSLLYGLPRLVPRYDGDYREALSVMIKQTPRCFGR